ncbi:MAG: efflux RND transporter permease subunit [Burkholderiales bacterium]
MFNLIVASSLRQRLLVLIFAFGLMLYGGWYLPTLKVDVFPDLNKPVVTIMTEAEGLAPEEVEQLLTQPLETAANGLPGITRIRSVSAVGLSIVYLEFEWGSDPYRNRQLVAERLTTLGSQLPRGAAPQMAPLSSLMGEIMLIALPLSEGTSSPMAVREYADWVLRPSLLSIPGVANIIPIGGEVRQFRIAPDLDRLRGLQLGLTDIEQALRGFGSNTSGGYIDNQSREWLIRNIGRSVRLEDLRNLTVAYREGHPIPLRQVASVDYAARIKRGDAGFAGKPAVIVAVQKQPGADTIQLTQQVEQHLQKLRLPTDMARPVVLFRQADFIQHAIGNVAEALRDGAILVAVVLFAFLLNGRTTLISLTAIPLSLLTTVVVFKWFGLSINTMTLGGLAIAIGELVDDAVVDVENVLRRLRLNAHSATPQPRLQVILQASLEVRTAIVNATLIVILVFVPLFALPGIEGRLFTPLGVAYIVSILASLLVSITVTPVLCYYLLRDQHSLGSHDTPLQRWLKRHYQHALDHALQHPRRWLLSVAMASIVSVVLLLGLPRSFLPPFNEGTLTISVMVQPGTSLNESSRVGQLAEILLQQVPEARLVGRRTGRAELDEHAEGVHTSEVDVDIREDGARPRSEVIADIRQRLSVLPASVSIGQPISHRLDHLLSGVRAQIAIKIFGPDTDTLSALAANLQQKLATLQGLTDLQTEKQTRIPQLQIRVDSARASAYGITPAQLNETLETVLGGRVIGQILDENRRFDLLLRLAETQRDPLRLPDLLIDTPQGKVPLRWLAEPVETDGPNQIGRENGQRRIVISANSSGNDNGGLLQQINAQINSLSLPAGYHVRIEGQFQAQQQAMRLITMLAAIAIVMIYLLLYQRYRSMALSLIVMANLPLALIGGVVGLWLAGAPLSVASLVGFITLTGIASRNGILKVSHYLNLAREKGQWQARELLLQGALERLTPVLMTASVAALALLPLVLSSDAPGKEILHPVAVVIFGGLASSTLLDAFITPILFQHYGLRPLQRLQAASGQTY